MNQGEDYILDLRSIRGPMPRQRNPTPLKGRPWISVHWHCCGVYSRVYRNRAATAYAGACPKCARPVHIAIGPGGTSARCFDAW